MQTCWGIQITESPSNSRGIYICSELDIQDLGRVDMRAFLIIHSSVKCDAVINRLALCFKKP